RAEFAAIVVRALGLRLDNGPAQFKDVSASDWFNGALNTAIEYGLIEGFGDRTFRPNDKITREQAMVIIARAMTITGLKGKLAASAAEQTLSPYGDATNASSWAKAGIADCVQAGVVKGVSLTRLAPQANITRAEVAVIAQRLLQKSDLI
ncbi:MAG: S-layer homology domain-containing protein, partial [Cohnella sp.]|nr:S-layer homology domain-containing protein [Cohnella sp.]